jgi:hypothetical protein
MRIYQNNGKTHTISSMTDDQLAHIYFNLPDNDSMKSQIWEHFVECVTQEQLEESGASTAEEYITNWLGKAMQTTKDTQTKLMDANTHIQEHSGVITLCGSTQFFFEAMEANRRLTFFGWIVLQCGSWGHSFHKYAENTNTDYSLVKRLHFQKIHLSDAICVISNSAGYIGSSTKAEIEFAKFTRIPVIYFDGNDFTGNIGAMHTMPKHYECFEEGDEVINTFSAEYGGLGF